MHSRLNLRSLALTLTLLALPAMAFAQTSRVEGMALQGDYIKDYTGIFTYTSGITSCGNLVYAELGDYGTFSGASASLVGLNPDDKAVGLVLGNLWDGRFGTWGVHMREFTPNLGQGDVTSSNSPGLVGADPNSNTNESFDLMWGKKFGTTSLGLRFNRSFARAQGGLGYFDPTFGALTNLEQDIFLAGSPNTLRNITGFGGGVGFEVNPNTTAEISLLWQTRTFEQADSLSNKFTDDGGQTYQIAGRAMWQWQPNVMVVPVVKFYKFDLSTKLATTTTTTADNTLKGWQAGAAGNWTLGTNDLMVLGATFAQNKIDQESGVIGLPAGLSALDVTNGTITETIAPQIFAALETHVNSWLTLRFGARKGAFERIKAEDNTTGKSAKITFSPFAMGIGAGVKLGTLQLDAVLNDAFPQTLGGLFSNTANFVSFNKVTATYSF